MKKRLFTPGPTPVPETVALALAEPVIHHRSSEFRDLMGRVNDGLGYLFQTGRPVLTLTCSGTGGMESTLVSLFGPGDTIVSVNGGKFGERWGEMGRHFGLRVVEVKVPWGAAVEPGRLADVLSAHPETKGVYLTHCETSTGTAAEVRELAEVIRARSGALVCVDGVSAVGAHEFRFDAWGIDACVTASQKGLMAPPGLAFVALSERAAKAASSTGLPRFYLDLGRAIRAMEQNQTPWTPAVPLLAGAAAALRMIREEGIEGVWGRHARLAEALRAALGAMGLRLFSAAPSPAVTAVRLPDGVGWEALGSALRGNAGITVAGGQGEAAGKIFRIGHLGYHDEQDILAVVGALERVLPRLGYSVEAGTGLAAAQRSLLGR
ncbi:MAG: alanine--glyoxylate aminotransferase family protein [Bacteroidota bacterium]